MAAFESGSSVASAPFWSGKRHSFGSSTTTVSVSRDAARRVAVRTLFQLLQGSSAGRCQLFAENRRGCFEQLLVKAAAQILER